MEQAEREPIWPPDEIVATPREGVPDRGAWPSPPVPPTPAPPPVAPTSAPPTVPVDPSLGGDPPPTGPHSGPDRTDTERPRHSDQAPAGDPAVHPGHAPLTGPGIAVPTSPWSQPPHRPESTSPAVAPLPPRQPSVAPPVPSHSAPTPGAPQHRQHPFNGVAHGAGPYPAPAPQHGAPVGYPQQQRPAYPPTAPPAQGRPGADGSAQEPAPTPPGPPGPPAPPGPSAPPAPPVEATWHPDPLIPTAEEFARRRAARPADPVAVTGVRGAVRNATFGLVKLAPGQHERELTHDVEMVRRNFGGLRQVTVVNPKGGAGKTVAVLLLAMTFGQKRGGYVLAWDNNETQGTLGMRAQQDFHSRTVRDLLRDLDHFRGARGRVGDLSQYVRAQGEGMFDVLASDESATAGEMLTSAAFADIREVVSRFYKLIMVDTGNNVRAANWQSAIDATDQLVVTMSARNDSAETAARMLDHLEQSGRQRLVRQAVTVVSMPPSRKDIDLPAIQRHFAARTRAVLLAPYERLIDSGEPIRYGLLSSATREAWLRVASAVAEGL